MRCSHIPTNCNACLYRNSRESNNPPPSSRQTRVEVRASASWGRGRFRANPDQSGGTNMLTTTTTTTVEAMSMTRGVEEATISRTTTISSSSSSLFHRHASSGISTAVVVAASAATSSTNNPSAFIEPSHRSFGNQRQQLVSNPAIDRRAGYHEGYRGGGGGSYRDSSSSSYREGYEAGYRDGGAAPFPPRYEEFLEGNSHPVKEAVALMAGGAGLFFITMSCCVIQKMISRK